MKAIKPIHEGEEIFNDYGEIPRADLLRRYGYVTDNYAQYDVIELPLGDICQAAGLSNSDVESQPRVCIQYTIFPQARNIFGPEVLKLIPPQLELLEENDILDDGYVIPRPAANASLQDILPAELVILLTTLSLTPEEFDQRRSKNKPPKPAMETNQASLLCKILQTKQAQYGSSLGEDMALLANLLPPNAPASLDGSARRQKMALQVRVGEKEVLQAVLTMLEPLVPGGSLKRSANGDVNGRHSKAARV